MMFDPRDMLRRVLLWWFRVVFKQNVFPPFFTFSAPPSKFGYGQTQPYGSDYGSLENRPMGKMGVSSRVMTLGSVQC
jgi:hypothetical protein